MIRVSAGELIEVAMRKFFFVCICAVLFVGPTSVAAMSYDEAETLAREGDPALVEQAFVNLEAEIASGDKPGTARDAPFSFFFTTDPLIAEFVQRWRREFPASPHARLAEAAILVHQAAIVRGNLYVRDTPRTSMSAMREKLVAARPLLFQVLDVIPDNTFAAGRLAYMGRWMGDREAKRIAERISTAHATPDTVFWRDLSNKLPQWDGSHNAAAAHCRDFAPTIEAVTVEECLAVVVIWERPQVGDVGLAIDMLKQINAKGYAGLIFNAYLEIGDGEAAMEIVESDNVYVSAYAARRLATLMRDGSIMTRFAKDRVESDPLHPRHLLTYAQGLNSEGDRAAAAAAIQKALVHGSTIPDVRTWDIMFAYEVPERQDRIFDVYRDALEDTDWHYSVIDSVAQALRGGFIPAETMSDGSPRPLAHCERHDLISKLPEACEYWRHQGTYCKPKQLEKLLALASEIDLSDCP